MSHPYTTPFDDIIHYRIKEWILQDPRTHSSEFVGSHSIPPGDTNETSTRPGDRNASSTRPRRTWRRKTKLHPTLGAAFLALGLFGQPVADAKPSGTTMSEEMKHIEPYLGSDPLEQRSALDGMHDTIARVPPGDTFEPQSTPYTSTLGETPNVDLSFPAFPYAYKKVMPSAALPGFIDDLAKYHGPIQKIDIVSRHGYRFPSKYINPENSLKGDITIEGKHQLKQWSRMIEKIRTQHNLKMNIGKSGVNPGSGRLLKSCQILSGGECNRHFPLRKLKKCELSPEEAKPKKTKKVLDQMLEKRGKRDYTSLRQTIDQNKEKIEKEREKLAKKHKKKLLANKDMISIIENNIKQSKMRHVNIFVSSDSNLMSFFDKYFPQKPNASIAKGENIMILKHFGGSTFIRNFINEENEASFEYKYYRDF